MFIPHINKQAQINKVKISAETHTKSALNSKNSVFKRLSEDIKLRQVKNMICNELGKDVTFKPDCTQSQEKLRTMQISPNLNASEIEKLKDNDGTPRFKQASHVSNRVLSIFLYANKNKENHCAAQFQK